jgi:hypothetical protein
LVPSFFWGSWLLPWATLWNLASEHFLSSSLEIFRVVVVLVEEFLQAVAYDLWAVVAQPITQPIKLVDEVISCADS